ncbi:diphthamide biosynthesis protein [Wallemia mellicola]|uniref:2-(3-amino-3-carboxypropyl)histidine synthase subunit 2 n=1 Tax=Wallemia mellicola TaxID=1708541 RepID=A0AB38N1P1_9BASI|nr:hypothetical protein E3Q24_03042 [Wallemia mellicola]TIB88303.1 diphthamide biosynthesis protein [Wallemia mellicola]TIB91116.1 diphthamide biosynthesis protein [Wallemia mellicola]TIC35833.1 diphthamide biosynthesis protein [Wallemia mellicola]TIC40641.1 diphthamide biosynthesis protein [Wallemia mellicola]
MATITNSGEDIISNSLDVTQLDIADDPSNSFEDSFEIPRTVDDILNGGFTRNKIGLQFPDELLHYSVRVFKSLERHLGSDKKLYILADTTYNACCVDEVAAQHVDADVVVHYGHACLEPTARLPVIYVFGKRTIDVDSCVDALSTSLHQKTAREAIISTDVAYAWKAQTIADRLSQAVEDNMKVILHGLPPTVAHPAANSGAPAGVKPGEEVLQDHEADGSPLVTDSTQEKPTCSDQKQSCGDTCTSCDCTVQQPLSLAQRAVSSEPKKITADESTIIIYIGPPSLKLTNIVLTNRPASIIAFDPTVNSTFEATGTENRLLQRRYAQVNKAKDCDVFGLAVGTLSTASYLPLVKALRAKLQKASKKVYTVAVGKLNPAKLGNFAEIQCWCVIACAENSIVNSKEFHVPVITPFELEMALDTDRIWTGEYVLDFSQLLDPSSKYSLEAHSEGGNDQDEPIFSASTGKFIKHRKFNKDNEMDVPIAEGVDALTLRTTENALQVMNNSAAGAYLQTERSWKGLEVREGQDEPSLLESGRAGVARGYTLPDTLAASESQSKSN